MAEEWRDIAGLQGRYSISSAGRVRAEFAWGKTATPRILKGGVTSKGYRHVAVFDRSRHKQISISVHVAVARAYLSDRPAGHQVNHKNGVKTDNRVENLEYVTPGDNVRHAVSLGLAPFGDRNGSRRHPERQPRGETQGNAKLNDVAVRVFRLLASRGIRHWKLAAAYGIARTAVSKVVSGASWRHVTNLVEVL